MAGKLLSNIEKLVYKTGKKVMYKNWVNSQKIFTKKRYNCLDIISKPKPEIAAGELVVYAWDECHLQGDESFNYLWGDRQERTVVKLDNQRDRKTRAWCIEFSEWVNNLLWSHIKREMNKIQVNLLKNSSKWIDIKKCC